MKEEEFQACEALCLVPNQVKQYSIQKMNITGALKNRKYIMIERVMKHKETLKPTKGIL